MVGPETGPTPAGASAYADPFLAPLSGHYHRLPAGTELPEGFEVIADGREVIPDSPHEPTHHTIYPAAPMTYDRFVELYSGLPWKYGGKK
jgi:hypothetical protein